MKITSYNLDIEREELLRPFTFKGGSFTEKWVSIVRLKSEMGFTATGVGSFAVLWSDPRVFSAHSEAGGNLLMASILERALREITGRDFPDPLAALDEVLPPLHQYACQITGEKALRKTFTLNALIALDNALWRILSLETERTRFDAIIPRDFRPAFDHRHRELALIPLVTYDLPLSDVEQLARSGTPVLKIKIGQQGPQKLMLEKDMERIQEIIRITRDTRTPHTHSGKILYYLDANGRYESKETVLRLMDFLDSIGVIEQILVIEEPFPEEARIDVGDIPVRVAADESIHDSDDVRRKVDLGYGAMALKPAGKTLSASLRMGNAASQSGTPSFVADSACIPVLLDWNKNVAARLPPVPGMRIGMIESNGAQFYRYWSRLIDEHPCRGAGWLEPRQSVFHLDEGFYRSSGGIFMDSEYYDRLVPLP